MASTGIVLIVDDETEIRNLVSIFLKKDGYSVIEASNGEEAVTMTRINPDLDLIIMDVMMPQMSGIDACKKIRKFSSCPILFLTAKTQDPDKDDAYSSGGDGYLSKPFMQKDLLREAATLIRRYRVYNNNKFCHSSEILNCCDLSVNLVNRQVYKSGEYIKLSGKEYDLLVFLLLNRGVAWSLDALYENVWEEKYYASSSNTVMVHVLRLRQKIESNPDNPVIIRTVYGKGYKID